MTIPQNRRVLMLCTSTRPPFAQRLWQQATTLCAYGYEVSLVCPASKAHALRYEEHEGIHIYRYCLPLWAGSAARNALALFHTFRLACKVLFERGFDAIHAPNRPGLLFLVGGFFKLALGARFLSDLQAAGPEWYEARFGKRGLAYKLMLALERWTFRAADVSITSNDSCRRIAIERGGMDPGRVFAVRSGPVLERLRQLPPVPLLRMARRYLVAYAGVVGTQEGVALLLFAIQYIVQHMGRGDIHFSLVGEGAALRQMQQAAQALGVDDYVTFTGRIPHQQLLEVLNTADVCVAPGVANELNDKSTMDRIMDYMALGKPIVQFDLAEGRVSAQQAALYANKNDPIDLARKIVELVDDPARRARMGAFGRQRAMHELAWQYQAPRLLAAYECLFAAAAPVAPMREEAE